MANVGTDKEGREMWEYWRFSSDGSMSIAKTESHGGDEAVAS